MRKVMSRRSKVVASGAVIAALGGALTAVLCTFYPSRIQITPLSYSAFHDAVCLSVRITNRSRKPLTFSEEHSCSIWRRMERRWRGLSPGNHVQGTDILLPPGDTFDLGLVIPLDYRKGWIAFSEVHQPHSRWRFAARVRSALHDVFPSMRYRAWQSFDLSRVPGPVDKHAHSGSK